MQQSSKKYSEVMMLEYSEFPPSLRLVASLFFLSQGITSNLGIVGDSCSEPNASTAITPDIHEHAIVLFNLFLQPLDNSGNAIDFPLNRSCE